MTTSTLAPDLLREKHQLEGWIEGYLRTGRRGVLDCYEAFIHVVDMPEIRSWTWSAPG